MDLLIGMSGAADSPGDGCDFVIDFEEVDEVFVPLGLELIGFGDVLHVREALETFDFKAADDDGFRF